MKYKPMLLSGLVLIGWIIGLSIASWWQGQQVIYPLGRGYLRQKNILGDYTYESSGSGNASPNLGIVYGFLPYWSVDNYQIDDTVSHVSYFRLAVDGQGNITDDGGLHIYQSERMQQIFDQISRQNIQLEVTFFTSHSDDIYELVTCDECQERLIDNIDRVVAADRLDGVNLDLEFLGTLTPEEQQKVTSFLYKLKNMLIDKYPRTKLSIDVYGGAANMTSNLWDFPRISQIIDRVIIMGYDYKTRRADTPGSSSPTLGANIWSGGIWDDVVSMKRYFPGDKIILAVPFYGYAWETTTCDLATANTYPDTGQTLTYRGAQNMLGNPLSDAIEYWDADTLTPYLVYTDDGVREEESAEDEENVDANIVVADAEQSNTNPDETDDHADQSGDGPRCHIGFFENERSINYKIDLIENLGLGGIAIWALGYEGNYPELWRTIDARF